LLKLHGSVTWSVSDGRLEKYYDCRPAIRGNPAIVAPTSEKHIPKFLDETWASAERHLLAAETWIVVGYSFPDYDHAVAGLISRAGVHGPTIIVMDPRCDPADNVRKLVPRGTVNHIAGFPDGLAIVEQLLA
jgi:hypothetical protein